MTNVFDTVIVGGGFYGLRIALHLREVLGVRSVLVLEREPRLMERASYANQARVHHGYHYPRSILTAYRSRVNVPDFLRDYGDAVVDTFEHYYAIATRLTKTNATQFELFCTGIGVTFEPSDGGIRRWFNPAMVESAHRVQEPAFNTRILREITLDRVEAVGGIVIQASDEAERVE